MCATVSWGAHESFIHPIFVLKNGCDRSFPVAHMSLLCILYLSLKMGVTLPLLEYKSGWFIIDLHIYLVI
jgi:hypothetical protein